MNKLLKSAGVFVLSSVLLFSGGCGPSEEKADKGDADKVEKTSEKEADKEKEEKDDVERYYQIPSPDEMFAFIKQGGFEYDASLTNPVSNKNKYAGSKEKSLNFGIYTADLAYTAAFEEYQQSVKYFGVVKTLGEDIGIGSAFDKELVERVQNNLDNADSLVKITSESYYKTVQYLESNKRGGDLSIIAAGGWLESIYIVVNLVGDYKADSPAMDRIAAQKVTMMNLIAYMMQHQDDPDVMATLELLTPVEKALNQLKSKGTGTSKMEKKDGKLVLGGGSEPQITEEQFNHLKEVVNNTRNNITGTNAN